MVSSLKERKDWMNTVNKSYQESGRIAVDVKALGKLLGSKYQESDWVNLLPAAIEELKNEGYVELLGIRHIHVR